MYFPAILPETHPLAPANHTYSMKVRKLYAFKTSPHKIHNGRKAVKGIQ